MQDLQQQFGNIDIYLFDQLLKGRFDHCKKVLDAGCGSGRNLIYFLRNGFEVYGIDPDANAVTTVTGLAAHLAPSLPAENFRVCYAEDMTFADGNFDLVISSAVLHFAKGPDHFEGMVQSMWRVLKPGGFLFARLASDIGISHLVQSRGNGHYLLPDGSERFLVNEQMLTDLTCRLGARLIEPIKTTNVQNMRCMTTWCLQKM
ncbi:MAG TPA: class I SAM-dependent methyltransferase [Mucilaginibacter sp.]|nr:class I SAM-dependent methyltransferase [Mucilaginibacter sp.]